ncbi:MAG: polysaccharide biosynthesis/export family protein [Lutibacter sp.]|nr:polysaccharide biosynthesis/export family protein [Lutibacter sp.]MDT8416162.1 polysaccharide biosynthesis/export family protein [Lutibacter sp.]
MTNRLKFLVATVLLVTLGSCVAKKEMLYLQDAEGVRALEEIVMTAPKVQQNDILSINVSALDAEAALPFNLFEAGNTTSIPKPITYLVNSDGDINFPVLGKIKVEGLTTKQITDHLTEALAVYIKNPIVNIRLTNFKITVLGEVKSPGTYPVPNERISILEAIGLAGDLTIQGKRKTVVLVREQNGKRTFVDIDLTSREILNSPYFYLAQNDVLIVEPNKSKINSSAVGANTGIILSTISFLISILAIITR